MNKYTKSKKNRQKHKHTLITIWHAYKLLDRQTEKGIISRENQINIEGNIKGEAQGGRMKLLFHFIFLLNRITIHKWNTCKGHLLQQQNYTILSTKCLNT